MCGTAVWTELKKSVGWTVLYTVEITAIKNMATLECRGTIK
jgi:hypothetical protein